MATNEVRKSYYFQGLKGKVFYLFLFLLGLAGNGIVNAQVQRADSIVLIPFEDAYKRVYNATKVDDFRPSIDGRLDEDFWNTLGEWSEPFVQSQPHERALTEYNTQMKLFYDDRNIYVGIICHDNSPESIRRFVGNRDEELGDLVSVSFDPYHDYRVASQFVLNAGGTKADMMITDQLVNNRSWNAVWEGRTHVNEAEGYWTAEFRIPFTQLRYRQHTEDGVWGMHVRRVIYRGNEVQYWSLIPQNRNGYVYSFGELHGMTDLPRSRGLEISPYVSGEYQREPRIEGSPYQTGDRWAGNAGLDAKLAISDFTLDLTINPDYGQVEQDPSVMNLSTQETFYAEKRPFFLEGSHIFNMSPGGSNDMFYSRRLGASPSYHPNVDNVTSFAQTERNIPIIGALKLTGTNKSGVTIGVLQSITARVSSEVTRDGVEDKEVVEPLTNYTVGRVQKNWSGNTLLGGMVTSVNRILNEPHLEDMLVKDAFTAGIDFTQYFNNRLYYIDAKAMFSSLQGTEEAITLRQRNSVHYYQRESAQDYLGVDPTRTSLNGTGGYLEVGRRGNSKWNISEKFTWSSPGFDLNDMGYLGRADQLNNVTQISFNQNVPWSIFRSTQLQFNQENTWDFDGQLNENRFRLRWDATLRNRFGWWVTQTFLVNRQDNRLLRGGPDMRLPAAYWNSMGIFTDRSQPFSFAFDYISNRNLNGTKMEHSLQPSFNYRIGNHVLLESEFNFYWDRNDFQYAGTLAPVQTGDNPTYLLGRMKQRTYSVTLRAQVNITPDISIQFYGAPFTSIAKYDEFKAAADTKSSVYENRTRSLTSDEEARMRKPDFSFNEFRSNLVARWEYLPGSTLYLVWEHNRSGRENQYTSGWGNNLDKMFGTQATNTFMVKLNYWFSM
ncbi:carbohydrate binding family 9 domain-containing protein [Parabacteroides sp. OttesenSCG-928-G07]|nr:carbohydrate binding family 9 domain-containing protein [Parabacteroides sp. OttesenSCG-928-G21]MDL2278002.1 carbohydrate binding family 9 domain-containing protein [Parabacteroides sp. OttesenSCG-928-G07]